MKFATKLSLGCIALLSCALGAAGLLLTGQSFSGSLASTRTALQAQQEKEKYALERFIFQATDSAQFENYILASAAQQYAEQTADAARSYGKLNAWLGSALGLLDRFLYLDFEQLRLVPDLGPDQPTVEDRVSFRVTAQAYAIVFTALRVLYEFWHEKVLDLFL